MFETCLRGSVGPNFYDRSLTGRSVRAFETDMRGPAVDALRIRPRDPTPTWKGKQPDYMIQWKNRYQQGLVREKESVLLPMFHASYSLSMRTSNLGWLGCVLAAPSIAAFAN